MKTLLLKPKKRNMNDFIIIQSGLEQPVHWVLRQALQGMLSKKRNLLLKERERKTTITLPVASSRIKEVAHILRGEKNHLYLEVLWKSFQKIGHLKWTLMDIRFQLATDSREGTGR